MIVIIEGKSAAGKDAIYKKMIESGYKEVVSATTRPPRVGEIDGKDYFFKTKEEFLSLIKEDKFLEYRCFNTKVNGMDDKWFYGTLKDSIKNTEENYAVVLDPKGTDAFLKHYGRSNCIVFYITVSDNIRTQRAKNRKSFDQTEWDRRVLADEKDFQNVYYDYEINNEKENCLDEIIKVIQEKISEKVEEY